MELLVTENRMAFGEKMGLNSVRIFLQRNYDYGLWIDEDILYALLTFEQKEQYMNDDSYSGGRFDISMETAQIVLEKGRTPFNKQKLYKE